MFSMQKQKVIKAKTFFLIYKNKKSPEISGLFD